MKNGEYILVIAPSEYPGKRYRGRYCYEHHLVWYLNTGEIIGAGEIIHHKDRNKHNNVFSNLEKQTNSNHVREHGYEKGKQPPVRCVCPRCDVEFYLEGRDFKFKSKTYGELWVPCCSRKCSLAYNNTGSKGTPKLSEAIKAKIKELHNAGGSSYSISKELGIARNTVMVYW